MGSTSYTIGIFGGASLEVVNRRSLGVLRFCAENNIQVRDFRLTVSTEFIEELTPAWKQRVDGIILCIGRAQNLPEEQLGNWIATGGVPAVSMSADWSDKRIPQVVCNAAALAKIAAEHLLGAGCKSFLFHGFEHSLGSNLRGMEFQKLLKEQGKQVINYAGDTRYYATFDDEDQTGRDRKLIAHLNKLPKPLGIWAVNDQNATAISRICQNEKLKVPEQIKILGTDDTSVTRMQLPMLSSIHTPAEELGYQAAKILYKMIQRKRVPLVTELSKVQVVARESTVGSFLLSGNLDDVLAYIEMHACTGISVDQLPKIMGVSRRYFQKHFLEKVGHTPMQEIHRIRLERAKTLLRQTQLSIARIAGMVGFDEQAAFGKFFRQQTKMSPREYRVQESRE